MREGRTAGGAHSAGVRQRRRRPSGWGLGATLSVAAIALAACGGRAATPASGGALIVPQTPPLAVTEVRRGAVRSTIQLNGQVVSLRTARLYFHNGGTVATVQVLNGQHVRAGEVLASLDTGDLPYQIKALRLSVESDRLGLSNLAAQAAPALTAEQAAAAVLQQRQAVLTLEQDEISLNAEHLALAEDEVVAPFAGEVNDVSVAPGDQVGGFATVMVLSDPAREAYVADVTGTVAPEMAPGQRGTLIFNAGGGGAHAVAVRSVFIPTAAEIAQAETNGVPPPPPSVTLSVKGLRRQVALGATFRATITLAEAASVVYVPSDAIRQFNGFTYVDVLNKGNIAEVPVQVGLKGDTTTAILKGLTAGERVVEP